MNTDAFHVSLGRHLTSGIVRGARPFWRWLGNVESKIVRGQTAAISLDKPVYISGLARSGTSVLIEIVASHADVATHQYRDFPFLFIPYWWRQTLDRSPRDESAAERAHGDGLSVTPHSPEAMEEMLWMTFFRNLHDPSLRNVLDAATTNPAFEQFYRDHLRKLLLITNRRRYAAKGNYNFTRLEYLLKLFRDARFVVAVRRPREHVASLIKQDRLFREAAKRFPRSVAHLDRVGHFEFGVHRRCINTGADARAIESIEDLWRRGEEARGWARYWALLYNWMAKRIESNDALRRATLLLRYEQLCDRPAESLTRLLDHCDLADDGGKLVGRWSPSLKRPTYYEPSFSAEEDRAIAEETDAAAARVGYLSDT